MKRFTNLLCCFVFLALVLPAIAENQAGKPKMVIEQIVFDAGEVYRTGEKLEHGFIIKNTGNADLNILSAKPG